MADNTTLNTGSGGDTIASDDIGGVKFPRSKIVIGADGTNDGDVSAANPLPVTGTGSAGSANTGVVTVQGIASMTAVQVADNSGSLTVDAPVGTPVFVRLSDGSSAIATLPVSVASVPSHAVTNAGTFAVQDGPSTSGGLSIFRSIDLDETEEDVKTSAGQLYSIHCMNLATSLRYLKIYDSVAASVSVGTTTPVMTIPIPAATSGGAGFTWNIDKGMAFSTGICVAATTGVADNDTGAPGANEVVINIGYK